MTANVLEGQLQAVRADIEAAVDVLFDAIEAIRGAMGAVVPQAVEAELTRMIEALSFQDITGQRLSIIADLAAGAPGAAADDPEKLENGPALAGAGVTQADTDALLNSSAGNE